VRHLFELLDLFVLPVVLELLRLLVVRCSTDGDSSSLRTTVWLQLVWSGTADDRRRTRACGKHLYKPRAEYVSRRGTAADSGSNATNCATLHVPGNPKG
jgi:hypothetical protein